MNSSFWELGGGVGVEFPIHPTLDVWRYGLLCRALQFTGSATPPYVHLTSFYIGILPGLPLLKL